MLTTIVMEIKQLNEINALPLFNKDFSGEKIKPRSVFCPVLHKSYFPRRA